MERNWKNKTILFLMSQTLSIFGSSLVQYAIMWYITLNTKSGIMMTIYIICGFLPSFFLSPFAGVWADRYNRKKIIVISDLSIAIVTLFLAILFWMGNDSIWMMFAVSTIRAFGGGIQAPAVGAVLPQIVPVEHLTKVNGINSSINSMISLLSPMLSGALLSIVNIEFIFLIDVITALIAVAILIGFLQIPSHAKALENKNNSYIKDMADGFSYIKNHSFLKSLFLFLAIMFILVSPSAFLSPLQVARSFGDDVWRLTAIEITFSIGMMMGGVIMASWGGLKNKVHTMSLALFVISLSIIGLGAIPNFWVYISFMGIYGIAMPIMNTPAMVLIQEKVEGDFLGRVFSVMSMISGSMMPIGMLIFGPLADTIKIEWLMLGTGILLLFITILLMRNKLLIEAGK